MKQKLLLGLAITLAVAVPAFSNQALETHFINSKGQAIGTATLTDTHDGILIHTNLSKLPMGWHGFHIHSVGECKAPDFKSAGSHFNPEQKEHGFENLNGTHMGDMPNVHVGKDGLLETDILLKGMTLAMLEDKDGSALVLHAGQDDYKSNPAGNSGDRIACGVIGK